MTYCFMVDFHLSPTRSDPHLGRGETARGRALPGREAFMGMETASRDAPVSKLPRVLSPARLLGLFGLVSG